MIGPLRVTVPPLRLVISALSAPGPSAIVPGKVKLPEPPLMSTAREVCVCSRPPAALNVDVPLLFQLIATGALVEIT